MTTVPETVGVIGGGRMGVGIAHAFLMSGSSVTILEHDKPTANNALEALHRAIRRSVAQASTSEGEAQLLARATAGAEPISLHASSLVVEAVPEDLTLKSMMLRRVEDVLAPGAWMASNTSSLSIDTLADCLARPERMIGLHFFNPVPSSALVEIVRGARTPPELVDAARGWVGAMAKTAVVVRDSPGFASSRLGVVIALEAIRMLEDGVASAEDIDTAMMLGYRFPVGPLRLTDMVGLDVRLNIADYLESTLGERFRAPELLRAKVAEGKLGRKSGEGFFPWTD